jgi:hypothetical protein
VNPTLLKSFRIWRMVTRASPRAVSICFCSHGDLGGYRAPRDHTLAFRLVDARGKHRSNVVWVMPQYLSNWTAEDVRRAVDQSNGK